MSEEAKNIQTGVIGSKDINSHKNNFQELINELNKLDADYFNSFLDIVLKDKKKYFGEMNPIDFLLDWKYEIAKVLCTQKLELKKGNNQALIDKFKDLDFENNKSELMKVLQNLKVAESTQKIILDNFVNQKGFESLDLKPFEEIEEKYGTQVNNRDESKTIFIPISNDFIKLCKVIWRIIKNTDTEYKNQFEEYRHDAFDLVAHINRVFASDTNKTFFEALNKWDMNWRKKLSTEKFGSPEDNLKAFYYCSKNDIFTYFYNLSRIKYGDTEYTEFAQRLELPHLDCKVVILTHYKQIIAVDLSIYRQYNHRPANKIIIAQTEEEENDRRTTIGQNIKRFVVGLVNSLVKTWNNLSQKTKKIISGSLFLVFFVLWILVVLNFLEIVVFMSLALSWTIAIISFVGTGVFGFMFTILITDDSESLQRELNNQDNLDLDSNATHASERGDIDLSLDEIEIESDETPLIVIGLDKMENENNLSSDLQK